MMPRRFDPDRVPAPLYRWFEREQAKSSAASVLDLADLLIGTDLAPELAAITLPTLLLTPDSSPFVPLEAGPSKSRRGSAARRSRSSGASATRSPALMGGSARGPCVTSSPAGARVAAPTPRAARRRIPAGRSASAPDPGDGRRAPTRTPGIFERHPHRRFRGKQAAVGLAETPDVLAGHRRASLALTRPTPARPKDRGVGRQRAVVLRHDTVDVLLQVLRDHVGEGNIARLAALHQHSAEPPTRGNVSDAKGRNRLAGACRCSRGSRRSRKPPPSLRPAFRGITSLFLPGHNASVMLLGWTDRGNWMTIGRRRAGDPLGSFSTGCPSWRARGFMRCSPWWRNTATASSCRAPGRWERGCTSCG